MARRRISKVRKIYPDTQYNSELIAKFINIVMHDGKKSKAETIVYSALEEAARVLKHNVAELFEQVVDKVSPVMELKTRRIGGANYQVPVEVRPVRRKSKAMRWIIEAARDRGRDIVESLSREILDIFENKGSALKKRDDVHRMAEANKAYAHLGSWSRES